VLPDAVVVHTPHCWPFLRCQSRLAAWCSLGIERTLAWGPQCLLHVSRSQQQAALNAGIGRSAVHAVIPNALPRTDEGLDGANARRELDIAPGTPVVGTLCRLVAYKCVDHLLAAAVSVRRHVPNVLFLVAGDGPQRQRLAGMAQRLGLSGAVRWLGYRSDARRSLSALDLFVLCSRAEGMPYALLEAAQAGVPVAASAVPGNIDVIEHERNGLLYDWGRTDSLSDAILRCLTDQPLRLRLAQASRENAHSTCGLDRQVDVMIELYTRLLTGLASGRPEPGARTTAYAAQRSRHVRAGC
jgi:glycosyltransferase involved in cell wall biosynthesis